MRAVSFLIVATIVATMLLPARADADSAGIAGYSGMAGTTCATSTCHKAMGIGALAQLGGPAVAKPGTLVTLTFQLNTYAPNLKEGGLDVAASGGTLAVNPTETQTKVLSGELVHSAPRSFGGTTRVSWKLDWTTPTVPGVYTLYGAGLATNGDKLVTGDVTGVAKLVVTVGNCVSDASCNDSKLCTTDRCDPTSKQCVNTPVPNCCETAAECDDGNACTKDNCNTLFHFCVHPAVAGCCNGDKDCPTNELCTLRTCDLATHQCLSSKIPECCAPGIPCDDGNKCTVDSCDIAGQLCKHLVQPGCCKTDADCADNSSCTTDKCDVPTGQCLNAKTAGCCLSAAECADKNPCTKDSCSGNKCLSTPVTGCCQTVADCDDKNPCTKDSCLLSSCGHAPIAGCVAPDLGPTPADRNLRDGPAGDGPRSPDGRALEASATRDSGPPSEFGNADQARPPGEPAGTPPAAEDGCCRVGHQRSELGGLPLLALLALLLAGLLRRRRR